ncbi:MAG: chromate transporter [Coleofasciculaceae cyanobacterium]
MYYEMNAKGKISSLSLGNLVIMFAKVGMKAFGGALPVHLLHQCLKHRLLTEQEYLEALNWCQSLPGPNGTNLSAYLGCRLQGAWGALLATIAIILPGAFFILLASHLLSIAPEQQLLQSALSSVAAAAAGLALGITWRLALRLGNHTRLFISAVTFVLVGIFRMPTPLAIALIAPFIWLVFEQT